MWRWFLSVLSLFGVSFLEVCCGECKLSLDLFSEISSCSKFLHSVLGSGPAKSVLGFRCFGGKKLCILHGAVGRLVQYRNQGEEKKTTEWNFRVASSKLME